MPNATGLADDHVLVVEVAELPDGGAASQLDFAHFARRHANLRVVAFLGHQLRGRTRATHELAAFAGPQLEIVNPGTERNVLNGQTVAGLDVGRVARFDDLADFEPHRR